MLATKKTMQDANNMIKEANKFIQDTLPDPSMSAGERKTRYRNIATILVSKATRTMTSEFDENAMMHLIAHYNKEAGLLFLLANDKRLAEKYLSQARDNYIWLLGKNSEDFDLRILYGDYVLECREAIKNISRAFMGISPMYKQLIRLRREELETS